MTVEHEGAGRPDEWFKFLFSYFLNVDEARRLIASGEISARDYEMPVRRAGVMLLGLRDDEFGTAASGVYPGGGGDLVHTDVDRSRLAAIPDAAMQEPGLLVMWDQFRAESSGGGRKPRGISEQTPAFPVLADGNHRLTRRFLEGDGGAMSVKAVTSWDDIARFTYVGDRRLSDPDVRAKARRR